MDKGASADLQTATRHMIASADKRATDVSREMGKSSGYLSVALADKRTPRLDLMAKIANACGYGLYLIGHGEALEVTPEPCNDSPCTVARRYDVTETPDGLTLGTDAASADRSACVVDDATRQALMDAGRDEFIDELIGHLQSMRDAQPDD